MTENSLYPACLLLDYHSNYGPHKMTIPTRAWNPISGGHTAGTFTNWNDVQIDAGDMITDFVDLLKPFFYTDSSFTGFTIYTFETPTSPARPQVEATLTVAGTGASYIPATMANYQFRTTGFGVFKLVMLDVVASAQFLPVTSFPSPAYDTTIALASFVTDPDNAFSGRDGFKPAVLRKISYTLNEKLRREYRLT